MVNQTLMAAAGKAMQQKNPGAVVSAIRQLDHMTGTGCNSHRGYGFQGACTSAVAEANSFRLKGPPQYKRECPLGSKHRFPWGLLAVTTQLQSQGERPCQGHGCWFGTRVWVPWSEVGRVRTAFLMRAITGQRGLSLETAGLAGLITSSSHLCYGFLNHVSSLRLA